MPKGTNPKFTQENIRNAIGGPSIEEVLQLRQQLYGNRPGTDLELSLPTEELPFPITEKQKFHQPTGGGFSGRNPSWYMENVNLGPMPITPVPTQTNKFSPWERMKANGEW